VPIALPSSDASRSSSITCQGPSLCNGLEPGCYSDPRWNLRSLLGILEASRCYANDELNVYRYRSTIDRFSSLSNTILLPGIGILCAAPYMLQAAAFVSSGGNRQSCTARLALRSRTPTFVRLPFTGGSCNSGSLFLSRNCPYGDQRLR
jgi:hypothetical protein